MVFRRHMQWKAENRDGAGYCCAIWSKAAGEPLDKAQKKPCRAVFNSRGLPASNVFRSTRLQFPALGCAPSRGYVAARRVHESARCGYQSSVTAGAIFHQKIVPLTGWFWAIYLLSHDRNGISAMQLKKEIGGGYQTVWLLLHKLRKAMADRDRGYELSGLVEAGEGYVGGREEGPGRGGRGVESKSVVGGAVEQRGPGKPGQEPIPGFAAPEVVPDVRHPHWRGFSRPRCVPEAVSSRTG